MYVLCHILMTAAMKRRTADAAKLRRPLKRSRITDSVNGSRLLYLRFFILWLLIITMDFMLEFRFEFLWPCWLLIKSSFDSFRYQGMGLTVLFLMVTLFSDVMFFFFLPVQWLFFVASTYVWVQFVCNTDRGPCIATVSLWLVFVYVEASVRLRDIITVPFHLDLCRPFAAHCIGYPVVSLGYGFKSYVGFKLKNMRQKEVIKQNTFYHQLVSYALPMEIQDDTLNQKRPPHMLTNGINTKSDVDYLANTTTTHTTSTTTTLNEPSSSSTSRKGHHNVRASDRSETSTTNDDHRASNNSSLSLNDLGVVNNKDSNNSTNNKNVTFEHSENGSSFTRVASSSSGRNSNVSKGGSSSSSDGNYTSTSSKRNTATSSQSVSSKHNKKGNVAVEATDDELCSESEESTSSSRLSQDSSPKSARVTSAKIETLQSKLKDEQSNRRKTELQMSLMESEVKKLRHELSSTRQSESDTRTLVNASLIAERHLKEELDQLKSDKENMQIKVTSLTSLKTQDKALIKSLETKLKTEKEARHSAESQLKESKKRTTKAESECAAAPKTSEDLEACQTKLQEVELELAELVVKHEEQSHNVLELSKDNEELKKKNSESEIDKLKKDVEYLTNALNMMQNKNMHLESSLSSETRLKLDLFSALGDTRRQLEIVQSQYKSKCNEVDHLKAKIAEVMAVMPPQYHSSLQSFVSSQSPTEAASNPVDSVITSVAYSPSSMVNGHT